MPIIELASSKSSKIEATQRAFQDMPDTRVHYTSIPSGVSDQPIGEIETRMGAYNRLETLKMKYYDTRMTINEVPRYLVSIENGLMYCGDGVWHDIAVVMLYDTMKRKQALVYSAGIPTDFQGVADLNRYRNHIKRFREMNNVTAAFTNELVTRIDLLSQAIRIARGRVECDL